MVGPHAEAEEADEDGGVDDRHVPKERLPGERREDLGDDPHGRQDQDVDFGVAEDPEEVLPEQRGAPAGGQVERGAEEAVEG